MCAKNPSMHFTISPPDVSRFPKTISRVCFCCAFFLATRGIRICITSQGRVICQSGAVMIILNSFPCVCDWNCSGRSSALMRWLIECPRPGALDCGALIANHQPHYCFLFPGPHWKSMCAVILPAPNFSKQISQPLFSSAPSPPGYSGEEEHQW